MFTITATTTDEAIEAISFCDMRSHARERRDDAAAVQGEYGDEIVLHYEERYGDGIAVLYSPVFEYAYVNRKSPGSGESVLIRDAESIDDAIKQYEAL